MARDPKNASAPRSCLEEILWNSQGRGNGSGSWDGQCVQGTTGIPGMTGDNRRNSSFLRLLCLKSLLFLGGRGLLFWLRQQPFAKAKGWCPGSLKRVLSEFLQSRNCFCLLDDFQRASKSSTLQEKGTLAVLTFFQLVPVCPHGCQGSLECQEGP